jgi:polar amino acid transport system substrate-binding protein
MMMRLGIVFVILLFVASVWVPALIKETQAQSNSPQQTQTTVSKSPIKLGVREIQPFVEKKDDKYVGFSMDLWSEIAKRADLDTLEIRSYPNVGGLIDATNAKEIDVGIAAISITREREEVVDFTQSMFDSGLKILVSGGANGQNSTNIFQKMWTALTSQEFGWLVGITLLLSLIPAHIMYFTEGLREKGVFSKNYFFGIFQALGWTLSYLVGAPAADPNTRTGRVLSIVWFYLGVIFVAFFTATITTDLTTEKLQGSIQSEGDLPGKRILSITNSTASKYLNKSNVDHSTVDTLTEATKKLEKGDIDAVVFDAPALEYYAQNGGKGKVQVVGEVFNPEEYGMVVPQDSPLRTKLNIALLSFKEDGGYHELYKKWFGER